MGALDSSRKGIDAPFDAFLTRNLLSRSARVTAERLLTCNESWVPPTSLYYDDTDTDYREVRLTGLHYQYGLPMFVEADPEFHDIRVAYVIKPRYEDVNVRFFAYGIDGRFHRLPHVGFTSGNTNLTTITATGVEAVYDWTLGLGPIRNLGNTRFVLFMAVDSELESEPADDPEDDPIPVIRYYKLWVRMTGGTAGRRNPGRFHESTPHMLCLVEDTTYPAAYSASNFNAFSTDYGDQPVRITLQRARATASGTVYEPMGDDGLDVRAEPTTSCGLCTAATGNSSMGLNRPDAVWVEPPIDVSFQARAVAAEMTTSLADQQGYLPNYRVAVRGMGELLISGMAFAGKNAVYTDASGNELMEVGFSTSKVPSWNVSQWYSALQANRTPRAWTANRLLYSLPTDLWAERTPVSAWGSDKLFTHLTNVDDALTYQTLFQEPIEMGTWAANAFYQQGDAGIQLRKHINVMFTWAYFENGPNIEDHLYNVRVTFYSSTGSLLSTETFEGALEMNSRSEGAGSVMENSINGVASGNGRGFFFRRLNPGAGRYAEEFLLDAFYATKNWPSSDKPHRFWRVCPLIAFKYLAPQTFQVDVEMPAGSAVVEVAVKPKVGQAFYDEVPGNREGNVVLLHHRVRASQGAGWDVLGL